MHLGAAPGVGKTYAMLDEARRRGTRGARVVVAAVETRGRAPLEDLLADLPRVAPLEGGRDIDVASVLAGTPDVVVVDQLAHTNADGSARWRDVEALLDGGCDVLTTLDVSEIESLRDVTAALGAQPCATVPDAFVHRAEQIELADMTPEALQRRLAHGTILRPDELDPALANQFRHENLAALRELALRWLADRIDSGTASARECVAVALSGSPASSVVVRRAARLAEGLHAQLMGIHVRTSGLESDGLPEQRALLGALGGAYREVAGDDVASALVRTARAGGATQLVLGSPGGRRSLVSEVVRDAAGTLDVHVIGNAAASRLPIPRRSVASLPRRRVVAGWLLTALGLPALTAGLVAIRAHVDVSSALLCELLVVIGVAALGGAAPALVAAVGASALVNWYLTPPYHHWNIAAAQDLLALAVFLVVGSVVGTFVATAARKSAEASRARAEATTLAGLAASSVEEDALGALVERLRDAFDLTGAAVLHAGRHEAVAGSIEVDDGTTLRLPLDPDGELVLTGRVLTAEDQSVLRAFTDHLQAALRARGFQREAASAHALAEADELRNALLTAVSHDLRTPLASIKASVSGLLQHDVEWPAESVRAFLESVDEETDRLDALVGNLLDMSRLRTGALQMLLRDVGVDEVVSAALNSLGAASDAVVVDVAETLPRVSVDPALLERALANVISNAVQATDDAALVRVEAGVVGRSIHIRVIDRGPGIARADRERVFQPFQRLGDRTSNGVGLGLAVARGFVEAMKGELSVEDTPGGGATMVMRLPAAAT